MPHRLFVHPGFRLEPCRTCMIVPCAATRPPRLRIESKIVRIPRSLFLIYTDSLPELLLNAVALEVSSAGAQSRTLKE